MSYKRARRLSLLSLFQFMSHLPTSNVAPSQAALGESHCVLHYGVALHVSRSCRLALFQNVICLCSSTHVLIELGTGVRGYTANELPKYNILPRFARLRCTAEHIVTSLLMWKFNRERMKGGGNAGWCLFCIVALILQYSVNSN